MFGIISVTLIACQNNETSNSEVLATETFVDEDLSSIEIKHELCDLIEASYYPNNSKDCSKVSARTVKKFESNTTLTMMDIVAKMTAIRVLLVLNLFLLVSTLIKMVTS
jgi:hypothetical protein